ncbi:MAG: hypothetical protein GEU81_14990, partial [Nitriliruptorales bacterium]|nr:hypothetical protein [Nitriliruptorales bacterium]
MTARSGPALSRARVRWLLLVLALLVGWQVPLTARLAPALAIQHAEEALAASARLGLPPDAPSAPPVSAAGAVVYDPQIDRVLYGKQETSPRLIASTSKIMTALLALEAGTLEEEVTVSAGAVETGGTPGAATLNLSAGQRVPMRSLLAGLVMRSGNDAAVAVAEHVAGDEAAFVARMNARAAELGLTGTRFVDSSGLAEDPGNESTPLDLARLAAVAMSDEIFADWAGAVQLTVQGLNPLVNRNELLESYAGASGVKTGFTTRAGLCLVASATRDGWTLYTVVLGSEASFADTTALLDHGYTAFRRAVPASPAAPAGRYHWPDASADLVVAEPLDTTLSVAQSALWRTVLDPVTPRPAAAGTSVGTAELLVDGEVVDAVELQLATPVDASSGTRSDGERAGAALQESLRAFVRLAPIDRAA